MTIHRPTIATISLDAVRHNIRAIKESVGSDTEVMAVVKADAYGHGMVPVASAALSAGASWLGLATVDETVALRKAGINAPTLILGPTFPEDASVLVENDISVAAGSVNALKALGKAASLLGNKAKVHLKVDTGMGRFGFWWEDLISDLEDISKIPGIILEGCFTHFAVSDIPDYTYTEMQHKSFRKFLAAAEGRGFTFPVIHAANSGAILQHPATRYNVVRAGVMLYGMLPDFDTQKTVPMEPVMTLTTRIIEIRTHPPGRFLSYGCTFRTERESRIGIMPLGYGDGYSRKLSNRGQVIVRGRRAPIVGRVCMDQVLIDLTGIPEAQIGDEVLLWGKKGADSLPVEEVAAWMETITYEVTCALGKRVPRIHVQKSNNNK